MRAVTKAADIAEQMTLRKDTVQKIDSIEDNGERVEAVEKLVKPRISAMLVMYVKTVRVQTAKENLRLDCTVALNASGFLKNGVVVCG